MDRRKWPSGKAEFLAVNHRFVATRGRDQEHREQAGYRHSFQQKEKEQIPPLLPTHPPPTRAGRGASVGTEQPKHKHAPTPVPPSPRRIPMELQCGSATVVVSPVQVGSSPHLHQSFSVSCRAALSLVCLCFSLSHPGLSDCNPLSHSPLPWLFHILNRHKVYAQVGTYCSTVPSIHRNPEIVCVRACVCVYMCTYVCVRYKPLWAGRA